MSVDRRKLPFGRPRLPGAMTMAFLALGATPALATEKLTAIVQEIAAPSLSLRPFDILAAGTRLELQPGESIEIGYLASCMVERITGGIVVVNERESWVVDGKLERRKIDCANGGAVMAGAEVDAAVVVVRDAGLGKERVVADRQPLLMAPGLKGSVVARIQRLDAEEAVIAVELAEGIADLGGGALQLAPGGRYEITAGGRKARFRVSEGAGEDRAEALSRLILF